MPYNCLRNGYRILRALSLSLLMMLFSSQPGRSQTCTRGQILAFARNLTQSELWGLRGSLNRPVNGLQFLEECGADAVRVLAEAVGDRDREVSESALYSLSQLEINREPAIPALIATLGIWRESSVDPGQILVNIGTPAVPDLLAALNESNEDNPLRRERIARILGEIEPADVTVVRVLQALLRDDYPNVRLGAAYGLVRIDPSTREIFPIVEHDLIALREYEYISFRVAEILGLSTVSEQAMPLLIQMLADGDSVSENRVVQSLGKHGTAAAPAMPQLLVLWEIGDRHTRSRLLDTWSQIGSAAADATPLLLDALEDGDDWAHRQIIDTLGEIGEAAEAAIPQLLEQLQQHDPTPDIPYPSSWATRAAIALGKICLDRLVELLDSDDPTLRTHAAYGLGQLDSLPESVVLRLQAALNDRHSRVRIAAALALAELHRLDRVGVTVLLAAIEDGTSTSQLTLALATPIAVPSLIEALNSDDDNLHLAATSALEKICQPFRDSGNAQISEERCQGAAEAIPHLFAALENPTSHRRFYLESTLASFGDAALPGVVNLLELEDVEMRSSAVRILQRQVQRQESPQAIKALLTALQDENESVRWLAALALVPTESATEAMPVLIARLEQINPDSREFGEVATEIEQIGSGAIPFLLPLFDRDNPRLRSRTIEILRTIGPTAIPEIANALEDADPIAQIEAATTLAQFDPEWKSTAFDLLRAHFDAPDLEVRRWALLGAGRIGTAAAPLVSHLIEALADEELIVRQSATYALGEIGVAATPAIPHLIEILQRETDSRSRHNIVFSLFKIGSQTPEELKPAIPALIETLADPNVRHITIPALGAISDAAAVPPLIELLEDEEPHFRGLAIEALGRMGEIAAPAVPALIERLEDGEGDVRIKAIEALGNIGEPASAAIEPLQGLCDRENPRVRALVRDALSDIQPESKSVCDVEIGR